MARNELLTAGEKTGALSQLSWPGKRRQHVTPDRPADTRWFKSPYVGVVSFNVRKQIS